MLPYSAEIVSAFSQTHHSRFSAIAYYGPDVTVPSVPITSDGYIHFNGDAQIQGSGMVHLARDVTAPKRGEPANISASLAPRSPTDALAPFGQELGLFYNITVAGVEYSIPLGRYRIIEVPNAKEYFRRFPSRVDVVAWACQLEVADRFEQIIADDFLQATGPVPGNTVWDEIRRLSPIPVLETLADKSVPTGMTYNTRIEAIETLMDHIGGVPHMTRDGALSCRVKDAWLTETVPVFTINGTIEMSGGMSNKLYNQVVVRSSTGAEKEIVAVRKITDASNPMAVTRAGGRTYAWSSPLITTQTAANTAADTILARVSTRQTRLITITCLPRPDIEVGDFGLAIDAISGRNVYGEVRSMRFSLDPTDPMTLEMIVSQEVEIL